MNKTEFKKIAVIGAGAIGNLLGGILAKHGKDVTLIGRKKHIEAIHTNGLFIDGVLGEFNVAVKTGEYLSFKPDILFIAVKTQDLESTCKEIMPHVKDIPIVLMQNGVRSVQIAAPILGKENLFSCILMLNAQFLKPGCVTCISNKPSVIGEISDKKNQRVEAIQSLLQHICKTHISENITGLQWSKLLINSMANAIDGMTGLNLGEYVGNRQLRIIGVKILKEAITILEKADIKPDNLPGIPVSGFIFLMKLPGPLAAFILKFVMGSKKDKKIITSTLQSLRKGQKTEIDFLNGEFVSLGEKSGVPTPYNTTVVKLIHEIENTGEFFTPEELNRHFS